jgi:two-component system nitrogen regulation sensor histidine kinase GlnL
MDSRGGSFRFEGLIKAGALFFAALLVIVSVTSLRQISHTREYLSSDLKKRLMNLADILSRELQERYPESVDDPYNLYAMTIKESLAGVAVMDGSGMLMADTSSVYKRGTKKADPGIGQAELARVMRGAVEVSPIYKKYGTAVRSVYFPLRDKGNYVQGVVEVSLDAGFIDELTEQSTTAFFIKSMAAIFFIVVFVYIFRTLVVSQRRLVQAARGAGVGPAVASASSDDTSFMINSFHSLVRDLKEKEKELSELKERAEERARSVESYNDNVLRSITSGVMTFDRDGVVITANAAAGEILGIMQDATVGKKVGDVFGQDSWVCHLVEKTLHEGIPERRGEGEASGGNGTKWLGAGTSPLKGPDGSPEGAILVFTDITEVKDLRERMELKERLTLLGEMSAGIAHELRNPMGVIAGYSELLARDLAEDPEALLSVRNIQSEIKGMDDIIREFMNFSQPTELNITEVDVGSLLEESVKALTGIGENVAREMSMDGALPRVSGDAVLLRQAFINIVKNAIESMPGGGKVVINAGVVDTRRPGPGASVNLPAGTYALVSVTDTGVGIDERDMRKIFTPFFTTKGKGTGLGLALVQKILVYHGGRAAVESRKGKGTTFRVYLPVKAS